MLDWRSTDESSLSTGLLAEKMVLALGRVLRSEVPTATEQQALARVRELFETMTSHDVVVASSRTTRMIDDGSYFDALHVVERETAEGGLEDRLRAYADVLRKISGSEELSTDEREVVRALRELFITMGEKTLARSYGASRSTEEVTWRPTKQATLLF